jgi:hypothetical protein
VLVSGGQVVNLRSKPATELRLKTSHSEEGEIRFVCSPPGSNLEVNYDGESTQNEYGSSSCGSF